MDASVEGGEAPPRRCLLWTSHHSTTSRVCRLSEPFCLEYADICFIDFPHAIEANLAGIKTIQGIQQD